MSDDGRITATEQVALDTAHAAVLESEHTTDMVDTAVLALSTAGLLASPEQALVEHLAGITRALAHLGARSREVATPADLTSLIAELLAEPDAVIVYQARHESADLKHGTYWTRAAARSACEALLRRDNTASRTRWIAEGDDPDRPGPDCAEDLYIVDAVDELGSWDRESGYSVHPIEVTGLYDPDAEE